jgi:hypothetical protein
MRAAANPGITMVFLHFIDRTNGALEEEMQKQGGVRTFRFEGVEALLVRYEFPGKDLSRR